MSEKFGAVDRRAFLQAGAAGAAALAMGSLSQAFAQSGHSALTLPALPYAENGLEPHISARTLKLHHGEHHRNYVELLSKQVKGSALEKSSLEEILQKTASYRMSTLEESIHMMALLSWNHAFYWKSMKPQGGGVPGKTLADRITSSFGGLDAFKEKFVETSSFVGSGWVWLVEEKSGLRIIKTIYHEVPQFATQRPLLTLDVWEHAYYMDYENRREDYVKAFLDHLVDWSFAEANLAPVASPKKK